jgi:hypothetical protein
VKTNRGMHICPTEEIISLASKWQNVTKQRFY